MNLLYKTFSEICSIIDPIYEEDIDFLESICQKNMNFSYGGLLELLRIYKEFELRNTKLKSRIDEKNITLEHTIYIYDSVNTKHHPCHKCGLQYSYGKSPEDRNVYSCSFCRLIYLHYVRFSKVMVDLDYKGSWRKKAEKGDAFAFWWIDKSEDMEGYLYNFDKIMQTPYPDEILSLLRAKHPQGLERMGDIILKENWLKSFNLTSLMIREWKQLNKSMTPILSSSILIM